MEARFTSVWSEESEMIAHLQSMFWSNADADVNLPSPNNSSDSCVSTSIMPSSNLLHTESEFYSAIPLVDTVEDWGLVHQCQSFTASNNAASGDKRTLSMDDERDRSKTKKKHHTVAQVSRTSSSISLEKDNTRVNQNSSWCSSSEDDSNGVCFDEPVALKQSGCSRGCSRFSMNSQSLYAKKRRERINEKLKILQQLIPNGTKVDMSTMLEEAVQYVKFLQLQIKLLSSDETWMYAPLAYNGVAINLGDSANKY